MIELNKIYNEDCLEGMKKIPDGSVDCIVCDLPYGVLNKQSEGGDGITPFLSSLCGTNICASQNLMQLSFFLGKVCLQQNS